MILATLAIALCPPPPAVRVTCVHDGDSVVVERERLRLRGVDAPELRGRCPYETALAKRARDRLAQLLSGSYRIERHGFDRYGRTLVSITVNGQDVGAMLVKEGLAREWRGRREPWCR